MNYIRFKGKFVIFADVLTTILFFLLNPITDFMFRVGLNRCWMYERGIICPGCGGTRCVSNLAKGDFVTAFKYHPYLMCMAVYVFAVAVLANLDCLFKVRFAGRVNKFLLDYRVIIIIAVGYVVFGFSRNFIPVLQF